MLPSPLGPQPHTRLTPIYFCAWSATELSCVSVPCTCATPTLNAAAAAAVAAAAAAAAACWSSCAACPAAGTPAGEAAPTRPAAVDRAPGCAGSRSLTRSSPQLPTQPRVLLTPPAPAAGPGTGPALSHDRTHKEPQAPPPMPRNEAHVAPVGLAQLPPTVAVAASFTAGAVAAALAAPGRELPSRRRPVERLKGGRIGRRSRPWPTPPQR